MILLDIKNAFNSAPWRGIIEELESNGISEYIIRIIESYLSERTITSPNGETSEVTCGVPQGSILGPCLWNIFYNRILRLTKEQGVQLIAYADDLAIVVAAKELGTLIDKAEYMVKLVMDTLGDMGIEVACEKTETIIIAGKRSISDITLNIQGTEVKSSPSARYLGVVR